MKGSLCWYFYSTQQCVTVTVVLHLNTPILYRELCFRDLIFLPNPSHQFSSYCVFLMSTLTMLIHYRANRCLTVAVTLSQSDTKALNPSPNTAPAVLKSNIHELSACPLGVDKVQLPFNQLISTQNSLLLCYILV